MDEEAGFTLIEVVCVLAIVALLAALVLPAIPRATSQARLAGYAVDIAALLKGDRNAAMRNHIAVATTLDADSRTVRSGARGAVVEIPADVTFDRPAGAAMREPADRLDDRILSKRRLLRRRDRHLAAWRRLSDSRQLADWGRRNCRDAKPEPSGTAGFTLLEALVALAVTGAGLAAIGALANSSLRATLYTERHLAEIETTRKIITGLPPRDSLPFGRLTGSLDAHQWRIDSAPASTRRRKRRNSMDAAEHRAVGSVPVGRDDRGRHDPSAQAGGEMSRAKPESRHAGFSLIEAMAAVALTATIVMALSSVTGQWLPNWRRGFVDLQRTDLLGVGLERLVDDISAAEYVTPSGNAPDAAIRRRRLDGDFCPIGDRPELLSSSRDRAPGAGQRRSRPGAHANPRAPSHRAAPGASGKSIAFGDAVALVRAPFRVSFAYAGKDRVWRDSWKSQQRLPDAVRVTVRDAANRICGLDCGSYQGDRAGRPQTRSASKFGQHTGAVRPRPRRRLRPEPQQ